MILSPAEVEAGKFRKFLQTAAFAARGGCLALPAPRQGAPLDKEKGGVNDIWQSSDPKSRIKLLK
jgi:hypothetical protein